MSDQGTSGNHPQAGEAAATADVTEAAGASAAEAALPPGGGLLGHAEAIAKLSTVVLGGLYVFGIIISNVQLIDLGISDFASLQARNVLTGFFFVLYFAWMLAMLFLAYWTIAFVVYLVGRWVPGTRSDILASPFLKHVPKQDRHVTLSIVSLILSAGLLLTAVVVTGLNFDYVVYPWGQTTAPQWDIKSVFARFASAYLTGNNLTAAVLILGAPISYFILRERDRQHAEKNPVMRFFDRFPLALAFFYCVAAISIVLAGYANNIYPNLRYNLGGGQPQVAKLVFAGKKSDVAAAQMFGAPIVELCCDDAKSEQAITTDQLVIWYQSDKFVYVSALHDIGANAPRSQVIAADLKLVRNIQNLPRYVQIYDGSKVVQIYERNRDDIVVPVPPNPAPAPAAAQPIVWAQLHPDDEGGNGQLVARAVVEDGACPTARFDPPDPSKGSSAPMTERWSRADGPFPVKVCEIVYAGSVKARIDATELKPRPPDPKKIVVIGDTGCRIAKWGMQDCNDPEEWPFRKIAEKAAAHNPDLIIHVGDYQYREACLEADAGKCAGLALGDVWPAWRKDFFEPAGKLLAAAPWVMLRGNHEDMARAGAGWLRLFSPFARTPGAEPLPDDVRPYVLRFGSLTLAILDVANEREPEAKAVRGELYGRWMRRFAPRFLPDPARQNWLFLHKPPWVHLGCKDADCKQTPDPLDTLNSVRDRLRNGPPPTFDLVFGGDTHMFQFFVPQDRKISPQLVAGMSGTLLEAERAYPDAALDKPVKGPLFDVDGTLWMHRGFGYLVLTKQAGAWSAALHDPDGKLVLTCDLAAGALDNAQSDFPCK